MKNLVLAIFIIFLIGCGKNDNSSISTMDTAIEYTKDTYNSSKKQIDEYSQKTSNKLNMYSKKLLGSTGEYLALEYYETLGWEEIDTNKNNKINGYDLALKNKKGNLLIVEVKSTRQKNKKFRNHMLNSKSKYKEPSRQMSRKWVKSHANSLPLEYKRKVVKNQYDREVFFFNFKDLKGSIHKVKGIDNHTVQYMSLSIGELIKKVAKRKGIKAAKLAKKYKGIIKGGIQATVMAIKVSSEGIKNASDDPMTYVIATIAYFASDYAVDLLVDELDKIIDDEEK